MSSFVEMVNGRANLTISTIIPVNIATEIRVIMISVFIFSFPCKGQLYYLRLSLGMYIDRQVAS